MKKKVFVLLLTLVCLLTLLPAVGSASSDETYVECYHEKCPGYCYVYDQPDSINGRNLGRMNNGTRVSKYNYVSNNQGGWVYISGYNTKGAFIYGYVHSWSLHDSTIQPTGSPSGRYVDCYHEKCPGYCYVYDQPDSVNGRNLGRMNNGTRVSTYNYVSNNQGGWYYISGYNTKGAFIYGYVHSWSLN